MKKNCLVILNYNDFETTNRLIKSVWDYQILDEIIIVDNCSTDDSVKRFGEIENSKVNFIVTEKNEGYASGNNQGIKHAIKNIGADNIIVANPDVYFDAKTIEKLIFELNTSKDIAIVTAQMRELKNGEYIKSSMSAWKKPTYRFCIMNSLMFASKGAKNIVRYDKEHFESEYSEVFAVQGSLFVLKASIMQKVGFMDEDTFLYFEESILGCRIEDSNYKVRIYNNLFYNHDHSITIDKNIKNKINKFKILNESQGIYIRKYLKKSSGQLKLYEILSKIGILERKILYSILKVLRK